MIFIDTNQTARQIHRKFPWMTKRAFNELYNAWGLIELFEFLNKISAQVK